MKKFTTLALVGAMTAAMTCTAFADGLMSKTGNDSSAEKYAISFEGLTEEQVASITTIVADVTVTSGFVNGCIGGNVDGNWTSGNCDIGGDVNAFVWNVGGSLVAKDDAGNLAPYAEVQFWWVNPVYDKDGNETGEAGTATLNAVALLDAAGNAVVAGAAPVAPADPSGDVAPVAYLAAIVAVAGIAMVASKKRA